MSINYKDKAIEEIRYKIDMIEIARRKVEINSRYERACACIWAYRDIDLITFELAISFIEMAVIAQVNALSKYSELKRK